MIQTIFATFKDGVLVPDRKLDIPDGARVRLIIADAVNFHRPTLDELDEFDRYCNENAITPRESFLSRDQLHERKLS